MQPFAHARTYPSAIRQHGLSAILRVSDIGVVAGGQADPGIGAPDRWAEGWACSEPRPIALHGQAWGSMGMGRGAWSVTRGLPVPSSAHEEPMGPWPVMA